MNQSNRIRAALCASAALAAAVSMPAGAGEMLGRMTVEIDVQGAQSWTAGSDYGNTRIAEHYRIVTHVKSDGTPSPVNTIDPGFARKQMAKAAAVQRKVAEAQKRQGVTITVPRTPAEQQAFAAKMQQEQAACGADMQCLMDLSAKYTPVLTAMSMQAGGVSEQDVDAVDLDAEDEARFLDFFGYDGCPTQIEIRIDHKAEGAYADVAGMIPWSESHSADYRGTDIDRKMQCLNQQTVYDLKDRTIYTHGFGTPAPRGRSMRKDRLHGETVNEDVDLSGTSEALAWVAEQLRAAPASGTRTTTLPPQRARGGVVTSGAQSSGEIRVSLKWSFEPGVGPK